MSDNRCHFAKSLTVFSLALFIAHAPSPARATDDACIEDWSKAARVVVEEKLIPVERLSRIAVALVNGAIVRTTLCREQGTYVYRFLVRDRMGHLRKYAIDARNPIGK
ncbi:MAG: hypothetical protein KDJ37_16240 [Hyphomicrobiaceae bacterium]|nr:hypothetical protein [Hyphomicrobiaceae bacterium]